jgi:hypothetical protein
MCIGQVEDLLPQESGKPESSMKKEGHPAGVQGLDASDKNKATKSDLILIEPSKMIQDDRKVRDV